MGQQMRIQILILGFKGLTSHRNIMVGSKGGAVVRALASQQCDPGSTRGIDAIMG